MKEVMIGDKIQINEMTFEELSNASYIFIV